MENVSARHLQYWGWPHDMGQFFLIFRTNSVIACGTCEYMLRGFLRICHEGEMASEIPEILYTFGPLLNTFTSVGMLFRHNLLQFE